MTDKFEAEMTVNEWLSLAQQWYCNQNINEMCCLEELVKHVPAALFDPHIDEAKSLAIGYWMDACMRIHHHEASLCEVEAAYGYLQFSYGKMQEMASDIRHELAVKKWCLQRMDTLIVVLLEFCQSQCEEYWQKEANSLIEAHVVFMTAQNHLNLSQEMISA
ncbi:hypothetical protein [Enterovibrio baiacu]|uniref:hypothetical protein n=1 Tax=Enterovibrio baiacu TaxID=2491023 RepID=UPI0010129280|nr:hypothetical protein [Enterovibrio baiacu]MBE1273986.1 hypothetical protein [Enterovibrio baiacu]